MELKYYVLEVNGKFKGNYNNEKDAIRDYYLSNEFGNNTDLYKVIVEDEGIIKTKLFLLETKTKTIT